MDAFPAIAYDRDASGDRRKLSFLWRVFRYERDGASRKLDMLLIPLLRTQGTKPAAAPPAAGVSWRPSS